MIALLFGLLFAVLILRLTLQHRRGTLKEVSIEKPPSFISFIHASELPSSGLIEDRSPVATVPSVHDAFSSDIPDEELRPSIDTPDPSPFFDNGTEHPLLLASLSSYGLPLVIDSGSYHIKVGFANEDKPSTVFPTVVGYNRYHLCGAPKEPEDIYLSHIGELALKLGCGMLDLNNPIVNGNITRMDEVSEIWRYIYYNRLRKNSADYPVMLTDATWTNSEDKAKMIQIWFEQFEVPALIYAPSSFLSLYSTGHTTGLVLDSGHSITRAVPIYQGRILSHAITSLEFGGSDLTNYLARIIPQMSPTKRKDIECVNQLKEKYCHVALDYDAEQLRKGSPIGQDSVRCPEGLFRPSLLELNETNGVHHLVYQTIMKCDETIRQKLFNNIVLAGGNTRFEGLTSRMQREVSALAPSSVVVNVRSAVNEAAWIGGSKLANSNHFSDKCISRAEYDEFGPLRVHQKSFA